MDIWKGGKKVWTVSTGMRETNKNQMGVRGRQKKTYSGIDVYKITMVPKNL